MRIYIQTLPHKHQRYNTLGDWQWKHPDYAPNPNGADLTIYVSETKNDVYNFLIGIHELVEAVLCRMDGVTEESVDRFDLSHPELKEPGLSPEAPYHKQHVFAELIERQMALRLGFNWAEYEKNLEEVQS